MIARLFRISSLLIAFNISLVLFPSSVFGDVSFPSNPKTMAECDEAVSEMRAMAEREHELGSQGIKQRNAIPFECAGDERCRAAYYDQCHQLHLEIGKHFDERNRIHKELRKLEKTCRTAAQASEQLAAKAMRELKDAYDQAKRAYDQAKALYERIRNGPSEAYEKRNDAHSDVLELAMDKAKQRILDVPKSEIIGAIQDASFDQLKSQIQQLNGDMAALESAIQSVGAEAQPTVVPLSRGRNSGSAMFQEAINEAEQDARDPSARKARERLAQEQRAAAKAQEDQSSRGTWNVIGMLGNAVLAAAEGQTSTERMQLAINSLAQPAEEPDTSGLSAEDDDYTSSSDAMQGSIGLAIDECLRQENASDIGNKLTALPDSNLNLKMRGTIAACDFMIQTYSQCLPDQRAQQVVNQYKATREQTLRTCRQVSSIDNCLDSPFGGTVKANVVRPSGRGGRNNGASTGNRNGNRSAQESMHYDACLKVGDPGCGRH